MLGMATKDRYLVDVFSPCFGYDHDVLDTTDQVGVATCVACMTSRFVNECQHMDLSRIEHLDESELIDHFIDRDAMSVTFDSDDY